MYQLDPDLSILYNLILFIPEQQTGSDITIGIAVVSSVHVDITQVLGRLD